METQPPSSSQTTMAVTRDESNAISGKVIVGKCMDGLVRGRLRDLIN
jgi:hypothetical protein